LLISTIGGNAVRRALPEGGSMKAASRLFTIVLVVSFAAWSLSTGCTKEGAGPGEEPSALEDIFGQFGDEAAPSPEAEETTPPPDEEAATTEEEASEEPELFSGELLKKLTAGDDVEENANFGYSVSIGGDFAMVGAPNKDYSPTAKDYGAVYVYELKDGQWQPFVQKELFTGNIGYPVAPSNTYFGKSVSVDGDRAVVGMPGFDPLNPLTLEIEKTDVGLAIMYRRSGNVWYRSYIHPQEAPDNAAFGSSVAMSGEYAIVGAPREDFSSTMDSSGAAYIYKLNVNTWQLDRKISFSGQAGARFGASVGISGNFAIVGVPMWSWLTGDAIGGVHIYEKSGDQWELKKNMSTPNPNDYSQFGSSVAISEKYAVIGAPGENHEYNSAGAVYVYRRDGDSWVEDGTLYSSKPETNGTFGNSVAVSGDYIIVCASKEVSDGKEGAIYVFHRTDGWGAPTRITDETAEGGARFGSSVDMDGLTVIVGASAKDEDGKADAGAAYIYE